MGQPLTKRRQYDTSREAIMVPHPLKRSAHVLAGAWLAMLTFAASARAQNTFFVAVDEWGKGFACYVPGRFSTPLPPGSRRVDLCGVNRRFGLATWTHLP